MAYFIGIIVILLTPLWFAIPFFIVDWLIKKINKIPKNLRFLFTLLVLYVILVLLYKLT
jgi:hypothetical protein